MESAQNLGATRHFFFSLLRQYPNLIDEGNGNTRIWNESRAHMQGGKQNLWVRGGYRLGGFHFLQMCLRLWGRGEGGFPRSGSITVFGLELREYSAFLPFHCTSLFLRFVYYGLIWGKWSVLLVIAS